MNLVEETENTTTGIKNKQPVKKESKPDLTQRESVGKEKITEEIKRDGGFRSLSFVPTGTGFIAKNKGLLFSALLILISIGLVLLVAKPTYANYVEGKDVLAAKQQELADLDLRVSQLKKVERLVATIEHNTDLTTQAVSEKDEIPVVMAMVQKISANSGVKISSFSYAGLTNSSKPTAGVSQTKVSQKSTSDFDAFRLNIALTGKYDNLKKFLENIEDSRRILTVSNFSYSIEKTTTEVLGDNYTLKVLLTSYYKDFDPVASEIELDKYASVVQVLEQLDYTSVDLNDTNLGKIDPFSRGNKGDSKNNTNNQNKVEVNSVETTSGFGQSGTSTGNTTTQDSGTQSTGSSDSSSQDVEAKDGDVSKILHDMLLKEGVGN